MTQTNHSTPTLIKQTTFEYEQQMTVVNTDHIQTILMSALPDLWRIQQTLFTYQIRPEIMPFIVKAIGDICHSSKRGRVIIDIEPNQDGDAELTQVRATDIQNIKQTIIYNKE